MLGVIWSCYSLCAVHSLPTVSQDGFAFCELQLFGECLSTVRGLSCIASHLSFPVSRSPKERKLSVIGCTLLCQSRNCFTKAPWFAVSRETELNGTNMSLIKSVNLLSCWPLLMFTSCARADKHSSHPFLTFLLLCLWFWKG